MSNYFYVAPEQLIRDRAEFAQKGIARGRSIIRSWPRTARRPIEKLNRVHHRN